jgi:hypothetical protein
MTAPGNDGAPGQRLDRQAALPAETARRRPRPRSSSRAGRRPRPPRRPRRYRCAMPRGGRTQRRRSPRPSRRPTGGPPAAPLDSCAQRSPARHVAAAAITERPHLRISASADTVAPHERPLRRSRCGECCVRSVAARVMRSWSRVPLDSAVAHAGESCVPFCSTSRSCDIG